jgi:nucleoside-diphosphate-sugar epimerase
MKILITGGCGFLGERLARALLSRGCLAAGGTTARPITNIVLADRVTASPDLAADPRIQCVVGDLLTLMQADRLPEAGTEVVFHLAAAVSGECEADFDLGLRANLDTTRVLLDRCRAMGGRPLLVFSSSVAVFGTVAGQLLPAAIQDDTLPTPQSSYGIQKFMCEQLVTDYTRKRFIDGRSVRLMTVVVRSGKPNAAASSFLSGMIREPLAGIRSRVPVSPDTCVALASPERTVEGLLRAAQSTPVAWGPRTALNLPALSVTVREMAQALERVGGPAAATLLDWKADPATERIVSSWPSRVQATRAVAMGLEPDVAFEDIVRAYVHENLDSLKFPVQ